MNKENLIGLTATAAAAELARGTFSAQDYAAAVLERIQAVEPEIQAFAHLDAEHAMEQAREWALQAPKRGIVVTGSITLVGDAIQLAEREGWKP